MTSSEKDGVCMAFMVFNTTFNNIGELCPKFQDLPNEANFIWLFTNEDISVFKRDEDEVPTRLVAFFYNIYTYLKNEIGVHNFFINKVIYLKDKPLWLESNMHSIRINNCRMRKL
jgi:hypothetical protein